MSILLKISLYSLRHFNSCYMTVMVPGKEKKKKRLKKARRNFPDGSEIKTTLEAWV